MSSGHGQLHCVRMNNIITAETKFEKINLRWRGISFTVHKQLTFFIHLRMRTRFNFRHIVRLISAADNRRLAFSSAEEFTNNFTGGTSWWNNSEHVPPNLEKNPQKHQKKKISSNVRKIAGIQERNRHFREKFRLDCDVQKNAGIQERNRPFWLYCMICTCWKEKCDSHDYFFVMMVMIKQENGTWLTWISLFLFDHNTLLGFKRAYEPWERWCIVI